MSEVEMRGAWVKRTVTWTFLAASVAVGASVGACGNSAPPATPVASASAPQTATSAPSSDPTPPASTTATPPPASTTAATPPPPPPVTFPASFTAAQTAMFAQGDRIGDAVTAAGGDCAKLGAALDKIGGDPAFAKAIKDYVAEALKLTPEQQTAAKAAYDANQKKYDAMGDPVKACDKNARVKGAVKKIMKVMMGALEPLMKAFTGAMGAPASSAAPK